MLKTLQIRNFALIGELEVEFSPGLNIITGETGAGKSIIVDALMMALGERASTDFIRYGENKAVVEGIFSLPDSHPVFNMLEENGYDRIDNELIVRREILQRGTSRCFLNDSPIPVGLLKQFGDLLVDFHGQHQHQLLLNSESHIDVLDASSGVAPLLSVYTEKYESLKELINKYTDIVKKERSLREREDLQRFELAEINKLDPQPDEEDELEKELNILENSETLFSLTSELYGAMYEGEASIHDALTNAKKILEQLVRIDSKFESFLADCNSALISVDEISMFSKDYNSSIQFDPQRIEEIRERLQQLKGLRKKYGTFENIFIKRDELVQNLNLIENFDEEIKNLKQEITDKKIDLGFAATDLRNWRVDYSKGFSDKVTSVLYNLGMPNAVFTVNFSNESIEDKSEFSTKVSCIINDKEFKAFPNGIDVIEFYFSANKGEIPKPLAAIASGGEISRVMLAIKSVAANSEVLPLLVFDEIDTGISGRIAQKVGITMKNLAEKHQIISITHLPQIAALGDRNIQVRKFESDGRTSVSAVSLEGRDRLVEIAKLLSGENVTEASIKSAEELSRAANTAL